MADRKSSDNELKTTLADNDLFDVLDSETGVASEKNKSITKSALFNQIVQELPISESIDALTTSVETLIQSVEDLKPKAYGFTGYSGLTLTSSNFTISTSGYYRIDIFGVINTSSYGLTRVRLYNGVIEQLGVNMFTHAFNADNVGPGDSNSGGSISIIKSLSPGTHHVELQAISGYFSSTPWNTLTSMTVTRIYT